MVRFRGRFGILWVCNVQYVWVWLWAEVGKLQSVNMPANSPRTRLPMCDCVAGENVKIASDVLKALDADFGGAIADIVAEGGFEGKKGSQTKAVRVGSTPGAKAKVGWAGWPERKERVGMGWGLQRGVDMCTHSLSLLMFHWLFRTQ
eukprot:365209-Chlamydomonas_euryale.AAC.7